MELKGDVKKIDKFIKSLPESVSEVKAPARVKSFSDHVQLDEIAPAVIGTAKVVGGAIATAAAMKGGEAIAKRKERQERIAKGDAPITKKNSKGSSYPLLESDGLDSPQSILSE